MRQLIKTFVLILIAAFYNTIALAQVDSTASSSTTTTTTTQPADWYTQPWVWIVGAIVLILLIIGMMKTNSSASRTDRVTTTRTVRRDNETT